MTEAARVHQAEERLQAILKAVVVGARAGDPASRPGGEDLTEAFAALDALCPPYDPEALCLLMEHSNSLRQNVDAYATNIDGFGHRFEPAIDFDADDADRRVADCIYLERVAARAWSRSSTSAASTTPSSTYVAARAKTSRSAAMPSGRCCATPVARWPGSSTCRRSPCACCPSIVHLPRSKTAFASRP